MRTLDRYIGYRVARGYVLVMAMLLAAFSIVALMEELKKVGSGQYTLGEACILVLLTVPSRIVAISPITALLGSLVALGELAAERELIAMQASGVSPLRIGWSVLKIGAVLVLIVMGLQEFVAPPTDQLAVKRRTQALSGVEAARTAQEFWSRDHRHVINVASVLHGQVPSEIDIYQFDDGGRLRVFTHARLADAVNPTDWLLIDVEQRIVEEDQVVIRIMPSLGWESFLTPEELGVLVLPVDSLSPSDLYAYIQHLRRSGQNADRFAFSLWKKISMPFAIAAMVLVSIPFVFGPLRRSSAGKRILVGSMFGITFYFASQILGHLAVTFGLNPALITMSPPMIVVGVALWLFRRTS